MSGQTVEFDSCKFERLFGYIYSIFQKLIAKLGNSYTVVVIRDESLFIRGAAQISIMAHHNLLIFRQVNIQFQHLRTSFDSTKIIYID